MKTKSKTHIMMFWLVTCDGEIMPLFTCLHGLRLNTKPYIKCFSRSRGRLLEDPTSGIKSLHHITKVVELNLENFCNHVTPNTCLPNSLDFKLPDYHLLRTVERETNKTPCNTKDELKAKITATFTNFNKEAVRKACRRFQAV